MTSVRLVVAVLKFSQVGRIASLVEVAVVPLVLAAIDSQCEGKGCTSKVMYGLF